MAKRDGVLKTTAMVTLVIIISKLIGFVRDLIVANYFGTGIESDAYLSAYSLFYLPVLLFNSCITSTLIPLYVDARKNVSLRRADRFGSNVINIFALFSLVISALMFAFAKPLTSLVYGGFSADKLALTAKLTQIMLITLMFSVISIVLSSILNADERYIPAQLTGFPLSLTVVVACVFFSDRFGVEALAWGVFAAGILQVLVLLPFMRGSFRYSAIMNFKDKRLKRLMRLAVPAMLSMAVSELNHMIDHWLASGLNNGDISAMSYAFKLITFMTGILIVPLTTIMFSKMSKLVANRDAPGILAIVRRSVVVITLVMLPIVLIAAVMNADVIKLAFMRGAFDANSVRVTSGVFVFYVLGVIGFGLRDLLNRTFHSMQDTKTTFRVSCVVVALNITLNIILRIYMGVNGLALATTLAGSTGAVLMFILLRKRFGRLGFRRIAQELIKIGVAGLTCAAVCIIMDHVLPVAIGTFRVFVRLTATTLAAGLTYLAVCLLLRVRMLDGFMNKIIERG